MKLEKIKNLIFILLLLNIKAQGQTVEEAVNFLKMNTYNWACEPLAYNTAEQRLTISLIALEGILQIRMRMPEYSSMQSNYKYSEANIKLSEIISISADDNDKQCAGINIWTGTNGIILYGVTYSGQKHRLDNISNSPFDLYGWRDSSIRLKTGEKFAEKSVRIINAIKFLAEKYGALIKKSSF